MQKIIDWAVLIGVIICVLLFAYAYNKGRINKAAVSETIKHIHGDVQKEIVL